MTETRRTILTGLLIGLLTLCIPFYLQFIGLAPDIDVDNTDMIEENFIPTASPVVSINKVNLQRSTANPTLDFNTSSPLSFIVQSGSYEAKISNHSGGSIVNFRMTDSKEDGYKYLGGYNDFGEYEKGINLDLALPLDEHCSPCLNYNETVFLDHPFQVISPQGLYANETISLDIGDSLVVVMETTIDSQTITKTTTFYGNSYLIKHDYNVGSLSDRFFVLWGSGMRTTEKNLFEELTYSQAYIAQSKEINDISLSPSDVKDVEENQYFSGKTDWVAIRNKYFINSLISDEAIGGKLSARSFQLNANDLIPIYSTGLEFNNPNVTVTQFFGPLDVDIIKTSGTYLDRIMNFGWLPIQPFSRSVLWLLKKLHLLGLNYGIILILFAFIIRLITGPLTKKSHQSTQKMQTIQPQLKKIQEKYKNDSQKLNREMMNLYKDKGVNPVGGCLPMIVQMPLLFSLFIVFRSTIEFRGAPFFGWISNLSQPDTIFNLPFNIPIYGDQIAFLPIILGISMFLTQRLSMATMDKSQKPMMYMMSAFFFLLFNSFPSGLNLYYTVYNFLSYQQQKSIKGK
jgi:YidC/Oxa1 family membrane protein insertase